MLNFAEFSHKNVDSKIEQDLILHYRHFP